MTTLTKPVKRETAVVLRGRPLVVIEEDAMTHLTRAAMLKGLERILSLLVLALTLLLVGALESDDIPHDSIYTEAGR